MHLTEAEAESHLLLREHFLEPLRQHASDFEKFRQMVELTIDLEATKQHEFLIKSDYSDDLTKVERKARTKKEQRKKKERRKKGKKQGRRKKTKTTKKKQKKKKLDARQSACC